MKKVIGVLAHVDAGKTTVTEQILAHVGVIRNAGRVDHGSSFMDHHAIERERGITVFSDQAYFDWKDDRYYWMDTPGHTDLSGEMEQLLPILDYAVLIVSCSEGVESHTETVWKLLETHSVPVLIFINKCDRQDADKEHCLEQLKTLLSSNVCDFTGFSSSALPETICDTVAEHDDQIFESYLSGNCDEDTMLKAIRMQCSQRKIFPTFFGSALRGEGIAEFMDALASITFIAEQNNEGPLSGRAFKVRRDEKGMRRVFLRILEGKINVRDFIDTASGSLQVSALSIAQGGKFIPIQSGEAGDVICINGLPEVRVGDGIGTLSGTHLCAELSPLLEVGVLTDPQISKPKLLECLRILEDENPSLSINVTKDGHFTIRVMGMIEMQILERSALDRFGIHLTFGKPHVVFMESILEAGEGIGHYEPLKHYAEVRLRVLPAPRNSGISFVSRCHVDQLALNWQRLIETHVFERSYPGVLIGAPLTDICIELLDGRAHLKHTEGGDFREATSRAIRCALMNAVSVLLEPTVRLHMRFQEELYGRVLEDMHRIYATIDPDINRLPGLVEMSAVCTLRDFMDYPVVFRALTHGRGILSVKNMGYVPARNSVELVTEADYDPRSEDTPDSVFCSHGAGHIVRWDEVPQYAHTAPLKQ